MKETFSESPQVRATNLESFHGWTIYRDGVGSQPWVGTRYGVRVRARTPEEVIEIIKQREADEKREEL